ncbi:MAG: hypothetical protein HZB68_00790 [Candidatus Aenigmarchaeota archaeon]|nr:hypothetical protein [Candidatus Aenigmarchaeota archaeon]
MKENRALKNTGVYKLLKDVHLYDKWGEKLTDTVDSLKDGFLGNSPDGVAAIGYSRFISGSADGPREYGLEVMTDYINNSLKGGKGKEQVAYEANILGNLIKQKASIGRSDDDIHKSVGEMMANFEKNDVAHGKNQGRAVLKNLEDLIKGYG